MLSSRDESVLANCVKGLGSICIAGSFLAFGIPGTIALVVIVLVFMGVNDSGASGIGYKSGRAVTADWKNDSYGGYSASSDSGFSGGGESFGGGGASGSW